MKTCATEKCKIILAFAAAFLCALLALPAIASAEDRIPVEKPALEVSLVYDGTEKTVSLPASQYYTSESITCINAGTYVLRVSLKDRHNYCWDDMTTDDLLLEFTVEKAVFDESTLIYEDETYVFDGKEHFIDVVGLPRSAKVIFNTVKSEPGVYDSVARIELGKNYSNGIISLDGATLTILAVELKDNGGSFIDRRGFDPDIEFTLGSGEADDFAYKLPAGGMIYAAYAPKATLNGENYDFGTGDFAYRVLVPSRYTEVKVYVEENGLAKEVPFRWDGHYIEFSVDSMRRFAVVYTGTADEQPQFLWLEIMLGVLIIAEAAVIVKQALTLKKRG